MKGRFPLVVGLCLILAVATGLAWQRSRGPSFRAYEVNERPLVQTVVATGRVAAASRVQVGSQVTGAVWERRVKEGDFVRPGDILAVLRADDLEAAVRQARAELEQLQESTLPQAEAARREAEIALEQARREARRRRALYQQRAIPREEMERAIQAEAAAAAAAEQARLTARSLGSGNPNEALARARLASAEAQLAKTTIRSEVAGTVLTRNAEPGDVVQPSRVLFEIAQEGSTEILVPFDEKNLERLALGQTALCIADAFPSRPFNATLHYIAPKVDPQRGTVDVRLTVDSPPEFLREDMTISVNVESGRRDRAMVVPNDALFSQRGDKAFVWKVIDGRAKRQPVQLGLRGLASTEIRSGLAVGDHVLASPASTLTDGERVRIEPQTDSTVTDSPGNAGEDDTRKNSASRRELPLPLD